MHSCEFIQWEWSDGINDLADVEYVILQQHGGIEIPTAIRSAIRSGCEAALDDHVLKMRDEGAPELASAVLERLSGGVAIHVTLARGLVDTNRRATNVTKSERYCLQHLEGFLNTNSPSGENALKWATSWYDAFRGSWQYPDSHRSEGLLESIHRQLHRNVPIWELHTYDDFGGRVGGEIGPRPLVQVFQHCLNDLDDTRRAMVPDSLVQHVRVHFEHASLAKRVRRDEQLFAVDDPYHVFRGFTADMVSQHRLTLVTEFRKDLVNGNRQAFDDVVEAATGLVQLLVRWASREGS